MIRPPAQFGDKFLLCRHARHAITADDKCSMDMRFLSKGYMAKCIVPYIEYSLEAMCSVCEYCDGKRGWKGSRAVYELGVRGSCQHVFNAQNAINQQQTRIALTI